MIDSFETTTLSTLWTCFQRIAAESDAAHAQGDEDWWKGYEGALTIVGAVSTDLLEHVNERAEEGGESVFDLGQLFSSVVPTYLGASRTFDSTPLLIGPVLTYLGCRTTVLARKVVRICESVRTGSPCRTRESVHRRCDPSARHRVCWSPRQSVCRSSSQQVCPPSSFCEREQALMRMIASCDT